MKNRISTLFSIEHPIIQAGMIWCSGWRLASAVSNAGGLGIIGSGSMYPDVLREHIRKCKAATKKPFAVNVPLLYPDIEKHIQIILEENISIVFTSAGSPKTWTSVLKEKGIKVVHVVSSKKFAIKCEEAGCDAIVAEGFEAGGHNGREETTTLCLIPMVADAVTIPVIAAGGIGDGRAMFACMALGAEAVQIGSRFAASEESSAHINFKQLITSLDEGSTILTLKELTPVRMVKNAFYKKIEEAYLAHSNHETLERILGRGRAKKGIFEGNLEEGELEIGQISSTFKEILPAATIIKKILLEFEETKKRMQI